MRQPIRKCTIEVLEPRAHLAATRIMPLGDSITEGLAGHNSYRYWLWNSLAAAGYSVDFVGGMRGISGGTPPLNNYDQNHEGHSGWRADQVRSSIASWANANKPDVVLLHIGTNDITSGQSNSSTATEIGQIIDNLRNVVSNVKILLAQIIPASSNTSTYADLNTRIANVASQKNTSASPITLVDQFTGFSTANLYDGIHPNNAGEQQMSSKWLSALTAILPAPVPPPAGTYLSDLNWTSMSNGWGNVEQNRSNGESAFNDGRMITLNGVQYMRGLGVHSGSDVRYNLAGGGYTEFRADIGVDDEVANSGSVVSQVYVDNVLKYTSPTMTGASATQSIVVSVAGGSALRLVVTDAGNGNGLDHADWASARVVVGDTPPEPPLPPPPPPPAGTVFVSDLAYVVNSNGWGNAEKDLSNGEQATGDGATITLNGVTHAKGVGIHAGSEILVNLSGAYTQFLSDVGMDDEVGNNGSVVFQVWLDNVKVYDSGTMTGSSATKSVNLNLAGKSVMRLVVTDAGNGNAFDHGDWASARLVAGDPVAPPAAPTNLLATLNGAKVDLTWTDASTDETGFRVQRRLGAAGVWSDVQTVGANVTSWSDSGPFAGSSTYFYRVIAFNAGGDSAPSNEHSITTAAPSGSVWVSDLNWVSMQNGWGAAEKDRSNGEAGASDGRTISLRGTTYAKGLGVHGFSRIVYNLGGQYTTFTSDLGIDDETGGNGSVVFEVYVDGVLSHSSGVVRGTDPIKSAVVNVAGAQQLWLVVQNSNDGAGFDHADWAGAKLSF